jgi:hypothetical protein
MQKQQMALQQAELIFNKAKSRLNALTDYLSTAKMSKGRKMELLNTQVKPLLEVVIGQPIPGQIASENPELEKLVDEGLQITKSWAQGKTNYSDYTASMIDLFGRSQNLNLESDFQERLKVPQQLGQQAFEVRTAKQPTTEQDRLDRQFMQGMLNLMAEGEINSLDDIKNPVLRKKFETLAPDYGIDLTAAKKEGSSFWKKLGTLATQGITGIAETAGQAVQAFQQGRQEQPAQAVEIPGVPNPTQEDIDWWNTLTEEEKVQVRNQSGR